MDETLYKVNKVSDYAEKIQPATSSSGYKSVEENIAEMSSRWKQLNQSVTDCAFNLQNSQQKWQDYEIIKESLETWLFDLESLLSINPEIYSQLSEKKAQMDKYRVSIRVTCHHVVPLARISLTLLATSPYSSSPLAGLQGYILYPHIAAVYMF